ncbi:flavodoxin [Phascolarctobacterium sp.]|uniref:flavodoxin n=1 Tax=Phascolarctobacterium sp. TaxID=2049039 RepID=UPI0027D96684|nr:flavodoxin [uncultured Phascolarctobacterium sp.]
MSFNKEKNLIVYFSRAGENYSGGKTVELAIGNTQLATEILVQQTGCEAVKLETVIPYPDSYQEMSAIAQKEQRNGSRPRLAVYPSSLAEYEGIFLGYPIWWGTLPMAVLTFLEKFDFHNKTIYPFCTHEGSGLGRSMKDIALVCPGAELKEGLAVRGSDAASGQTAIVNWLDKVLR